MQLKVFYISSAPEGDRCEIIATDVTQNIHVNVCQ